MFFSGLGLLFVLGVLIFVRIRRVETLTAGWRLLLWGTLGLFFGGFFTDAYYSAIFHWYGKEGLLLSAGGDAALWGGAAFLVIWIGLRAALRIRSLRGPEGKSGPASGAGARLDILVIVIAGLALSNIIPNFLDGLAAARNDLSSPPKEERVTFRMIHVFNDKTRRWASERREAVFLGENGEELTVPMPTVNSMDGEEPLEWTTKAKAGTAMKMIYYPNSKTVVSLSPIS